MLMDASGEMKLRRRELRKHLLDAGEHGLSMESAVRLQQLVLGHRFDVCRRARTGASPAYLDPVVVKQNLWPML